MSICTRNEYISWSIASYLIGGCRPFLRNFGGLVEGGWRRGGKYTQKTAFFESSRIRNFYITMELELKIGTCNNHNRLYLRSHFQRYSCTYIEDRYTKLVKNSVFPYILISSHLYLLGHNDSRTENSHGKHKHVYVLMYEFSGALVSRHRRYAYASDHKTLYFPCFFLNRWFIYYLDHFLN